MSQSLRFLGFFFFCCVFNTVFAQVSVSGVVRDALDKRALANVSIKAQGQNNGTSTDEKGFFSLLSASDTLQISLLGYATQLTPIQGDESWVEIQLQEEQLALPEYTARSSREASVYLRAPATITRITYEALRRDDALNIANAFNRVPGVYMQSGTLSTNRITIRGIGNRSPFGTAKIRAYLDEIPLTSGVGETSLEDIDLSLLQNVEIWKGPSASTYGAALGGVVHLQSMPETWSSDRQMQVQQSAQVGSYGTERYVTQVNYRDETTSLLLNYNRNHSDGYRANNRYDRAGFAAIGQVKAGKRQVFSLFVNQVGLKGFIPSSINRTDYEKNPSIAAANWARVKGFEDYDKTIAGLSHRLLLKEWSGNRQLSSVVSLFTTSRSNYESRPFNILRENSTADGLRALLEYRQNRERRRPNLQVGLEYFNERYNWQTNATKVGTLDTLLSDNQELRRYYNLFAEGNWDLSSRWFLSTGLNLNQTRYQLSDLFPRDRRDLSGQREFDPVLSPRLSLGYKLPKQLMFFVTLSHGFASPTLEETLLPSGQINPEIRPEQGWNFEIGSRGAYLGGKLSYELSIYRMSIRDLLVARRTAEDAFVGINAGKTRHDGLELGLNWANQGKKGAYRVYLSYSYADYTFLEFVDGNNNFSGNALTGAPPHHLTMGLEGNLSLGFYAHLGYEWVDRYPINDANKVFNDAYGVLNLRSGWRKTLGKSLSLDAFLGLQNLLDEKYAGMTQVNALGVGTALPRYFYPGLPRNWYGGLSLGWKI